MGAFKGAEKQGMHACSVRQQGWASASHHPVHVELAAARAGIGAHDLDDAVGDLLCDELQLLLQFLRLPRCSARNVVRRSDRFHVAGLPRTSHGRLRPWAGFKPATCSR